MIKRRGKAGPLMKIEKKEKKLLREKIEE